MILNNVIHNIEQINIESFTYNEVYFSENSEIILNGINLIGVAGKKIKLKVINIEVLSANIFLLGHNKMSDGKLKKIINTTINNNNNNNEQNVLHYNTSDFVPATVNSVFSSPSLGGLGEFTFMIWTWTFSQVNIRPYYELTGGFSYPLYLLQSGNVSASFRNQNGGTTTVTAFDPRAYNEWEHWTITGSVINGRIRIYKNGILLNSSTMTYPNENTITAGIQNYNFQSSQLNIWNRELDEAEVAEHYVYDTEKMKWVKVKDHPNSKRVSSFYEPFVYCLNTDKKIITIGNTLFLDWDDITDNVYRKLKKNCVNNNGISYLPKNFDLHDIHDCLDSGFIGSTRIVLNNGTSIPISEVCVNDVLLNGVNVIGVVKINAKDMDIYTHHINNNLIFHGSNNLHIDDTNLGKINCMDLNSNYFVSNSHLEPFLYHLLTDKKSFIVNGVSFNHYNSGLDLYL